MSRTAFAQRMTRVGSRRRQMRDADDPRPGEIYETRAGARWEVVSSSGKLVTVKRAGHRADGPFAWGRGTLKDMKEVHKPLFGNLFAPKPPTPVATAQTSLFSRGVNDDGRDPSRRGPRKTTKKRKPIKVRRRSTSRVLPRPSGQVTGAQCSTAAILARKAREIPPPHSCAKASIVQSLIFERYCWTLPAARTWAKAHGYKVTGEDVSARFIRFRQQDPKRFKPVGSMPFKRGLKAILGCTGKHESLNKRRKRTT